MDERRKGEREKEGEQGNELSQIDDEDSQTRTDTDPSGNQWPLPSTSSVVVSHDRKFGSGPQMVDSCVSVCHHYVTQFADEPRDTRVDHS